MGVFKKILQTITQSEVGTVADIGKQNELSKELIEQALETMRRKGLLKKVFLDPTSKSRECEHCSYTVMCKEKQGIVLLEITKKGKDYLKSLH